MTGVHSSSSPTIVRSSRVLPWPRSPSSTTSWPASRARSSCGITVSSKPCRPGHGSSPAASFASRLSRISSRRVFWTWPGARSSPRVAMIGAGHQLEPTPPRCQRRAVPLSPAETRRGRRWGSSAAVLSVVAVRARGRRWSSPSRRRTAPAPDSPPTPSTSSSSRPTSPPPSGRGRPRHPTERGDQPGASGPRARCASTASPASSRARSRSCTPGPSEEQAEIVHMAAPDGTVTSVLLRHRELDPAQRPDGRQDLGPGARRPRPAAARAGSPSTAARS